MSHLNLLTDLVEMVRRAANYEFHDFKSPHATPITVLVQQFQRLERNAKNGKYDCAPDEQDKADLLKMMKDENMPQALISLIMGEEQ